MACASPGREPGPGSFDIPSFPEPLPTSTMDHQVSYSIGSGRKDSTREHYVSRVGPGSYHPRVSCLKNNPTFRQTDPGTSGYGFGRSARVLSEPLSARQRARDPGPAMEQADNRKYKHAPQYSFGGEEKFFRSPGIWDDLPGRGQRLPGPGEHCPDDRSTSKYAETSGPSYSIAPPPPEKLSGPPIHAPGPGAYVLKDGDGHTSKAAAPPQWTFGTSPRKNAAHPSDKRTLVGPGRYTSVGVTRTGHSTLGSSGGWTMSGRRQFDLTKGMGV